MAEATDNEATDTTTDATDATEQEPGLAGMIIRDLAIVFAALSLWAAADTWYQVTGLWLAQLVSIGDAIIVGLLVAALAHEWGHYTGARVSGADTTRRAPSGLSLLRFDFEYANNNQQQFHSMTYGGHIFHWSMLLILVIALPLDSLGRIALVSAVFGFIVFASVIEYNIVKDTWAGMDPKTRLEQLTAKDFQQSTVVGAIGGLFALAALA